MYSIFELTSTKKNIFYENEKTLENIVKSISKILQNTFVKTKVIITKTKSLPSEQEMETRVFIVFYESIEKDILLKKIVDPEYVELVELNNIEMLQLDLIVNHQKYYSIDKINTSIDNAMLHIKSSTRTLKRIKKMYGSITNDSVFKYAKGYFIEQNKFSISKIQTEKIVSDSRSDYYFSINDFNAKSFLESHSKDVSNNSANTVEYFDLKELLKEDVTISLSLDPVHDVEVKKQLESKIQVAGDNFKLKRKKTALDEMGTEDEIGTYLSSARKLLNTTDKVFKTSMIFRTNTIEDRKRVVSLLHAQDINTTVCTMLQQNAQALFDFTNQEFNDVLLPNFFTTGSQVSNMVLIPPTPLVEERGVEVGVSCLGKKVTVNVVESEDTSTDDFNGRTSKNCLFAGNMGQGKSYTAKKMLVKAYTHPNLKFINIIDPDDEYIKIVNQFGGDVVKFNKNIIPNFLFLRYFTDEDTTYEQCISEKILYLSSVFSLILQDEVLVNEVTALFKKLYKKEFEAESDIYNFSFSESYSIIKKTDEYLRIKRENQSRFERIQKAFGILEAFFDGVGEILNNNNKISDNPITCFSLKSLIRSEMKDNTVRNIVFSSIANTIFYNMVKARNTGFDGIFLIDEFNKIVNDSNTFLKSFFIQLGTRIRKYKFGMWIILHTLEDMKSMQNIFKNMQIKFLFFTGDSFEEQSKAYGLTEQQYKVIQHSKRGNCFVFSGQNSSDCTVTAYEQDGLF